MLQLRWCTGVLHEFKCCCPPAHTSCCSRPDLAAPCSKIPLSLPAIVATPGTMQDPLGQCLVLDTFLLLTAGLVLPIMYLYRAECRARHAFAVRQWEVLGGEGQLDIAMPDGPSFGWRIAFLGSALVWALVDGLVAVVS